MTTFHSIVFLALLLCLFSLNHVSTSVCPEFRLTFEPCTNTTKCAALKDIGLQCGALDKNDRVQPCPYEADSFCTCRPSLLNTHYCENNQDCLDEEYCAMSTKSKRKLCLGCLTFADSNYENAFTPVQAAQTRDRCFNEGKSHPPCGYAEDLCSPSMPCDGAYKCINDVEGELFECSWESTRCKCILDVGDKTKNETILIPPKPCVVDNDCQDREVCATFAKRNFNYCVSCDIARESHDYVIPDISTKCNAVDFDVRPEPQSYIEGPNGRTLDKCLDDKHCTGNRKCRRRNLDQKWILNCQGNGTDFCACIPDQFQTCSTGSDCERGESCVDLLDFTQLNNTCITNAALDATSSNKYAVIGDRTRSGDGSGLNDDDCSFDWNCASPRRCTHVADTYGRCAGRRGCKCKPLLNPPCSTDIDCDTGEQCVTSIDAIYEPYCMSKQAVDGNPFVFQIDDSRLVPASPTPLPAGTAFGLTGDHCLTSSDCISPRACYHRFDMAFNTSEIPTRCDGTVRNCQCKMPEGYNTTNSCKTSADCEYSAEICTMYKDEVPENKMCMSRLAFDAEVDLGIKNRAEFGARQSIQPSPSASATTPTESPNVTMAPTDTTDPTITPESGSEPCIDVKLLASFKESGLVFQQHRRASVLCDEFGSCATAGHMVMFENTAMAMKSYCSIHAKCSKRTAWVNNPRMSAGLRLESFTAGLRMTVFSARFESWIEELIMKQLIHLGA